MRGPGVGRVAAVPLVEPLGELPYAAAGRSRRPAIAGVAILAVLIAGAVAVLVAQADHRAPATVGRELGRAVGHAAPAPAPGTRSKPKSVRAVALSPHRAVYRNGKLYLEGALPSRAVADKLVSKAAAVIGATNVIDRYVIDRRAPTPTNGRLLIDERFLFPQGSAVINPAYNALLSLGVTFMRQNPHVRMEVFGYTDDTGPAATNRALAAARAQAVASWIIWHRIDPKRFIVVGRGPSAPAASNLTPQGRTRNRRMEIGLLGLLPG